MGSGLPPSSLTFGKLRRFLRARRLERRMSQHELAMAVGLSSQSVLSNWEMGISQPQTFDLLQRWLLSLDVELELVFRDDA